MKSSFLLTVSVLFLIAGVAEARTWTSTDGAKQFKGRFQRYNEASGEVTVMRGYKKVTFKTEMLSEADIQWLKEEAAKEKAKKSATNESKAEEDKTQLIESNLTRGVLVKSNGKRFVKYEMERSPEYYIIYFSASW